MMLELLYNLIILSLTTLSPRRPSQHILVIMAEHELRPKEEDDGAIAIPVSTADSESDCEVEIVEVCMGVLVDSSTSDTDAVPVL